MFIMLILTMDTFPSRTWLIRLRHWLMAGVGYLISATVPESSKNKMETELPVMIYCNSAVNNLLQIQKLNQDKVMHAHLLFPWK